MSNDKRLFEVRLSRGQNHDRWKDFFDGVQRLNGKSPDRSISNVAVIGTHHPVETIAGIIDGELYESGDLTITEITSDTIENGHHGVYADLIERAFLPHSDYPAIDS